MKIISVSTEQFEFELNHEEHALLLHLLVQFPSVPAAHYRLSRQSQLPHTDENQRMLEESLQTHRATQRQQARDLVQAAGRFVPVENGFTATFTRAEIEWLLQVVNDVRVGSWLALGSPMPGNEPRRPTKKTAPHMLNMEVAGFFQMNFTSALNGEA